jgi:homospermidine synthase
MPIPTVTHARHDASLVMVGFGSIGKGTLPLILRHIDMARERMVIIDPDDSARTIAEFAGIRFEKVPLLPDTLRGILTPLLTPGSFLVNLSVGVSSVALIALCRELGALYLDTCIEPPPGGYTDPRRSISERSNYAMREAALALRRSGSDPTAVVAHGANPGMVSHLVKRALLHLARDLG